MTSFALPIVTSIALGAGSEQVGLVATAAWLPYLLFSLLAGHWLDRHDRRHVMLISEGVQIVALGSIPVAWWCGLLTVPLLAIAAFIAGCGALSAALMGFAYLPELVAPTTLAAANRALQSSRTLAQIAGPGLAGVLVGALGPSLAIVVDAAGHVLSALGIARSGVRTQGNDMGADRPREPARVLDGMRVLIAEPHLRALTVHAATFNFASQVFTLNLVLLAVRQEQVSVLAYGVALAASGIGGVVGTAVALQLSERWGFGCAFLGSLMLSCGAPILIPLSEAHGLALAGAIASALFIAGIGLGNANIYSLTLRQTIVPRALLTRSAGAYTQVMYGSIPLGAAAAGVLGACLGFRNAVLLGAIGYAISFLPIVLSPIRSLRSLDDYSARTMRTK